MVPFGRKRTFEKNKDYRGLNALNALNIQKHFKFLSSFKHVNFAINEKSSKKL
jgi:hypothetical protein